MGDCLIVQKCEAELFFVEPMECLRVAKLPEGKEWLHEVKWDGYRAIVTRQKGEVTIYSRRGNRLNEDFPNLEKEFKRLPGKSFVIDGEIVALDSKGRPDFQLL